MLNISIIFTLFTPKHLSNYCKPCLENIELWAVDRFENDNIYITFSGYTQPTVLYFENCQNIKSKKQLLPIKSMPSMFNNDNLIVEQFFVKSKDGEEIPADLIVLYVP